MLTRLGDLLRTVLRQDSQAQSTLREEIELTRAYVALEQMRFGDRLQVDFEIAGEVQQAMVPCFLLQPLIENAVNHGLRGARKTGIISVIAAGQEGELVLPVTDNGIGLPAEDPSEMKIGVGLRSTRERLARMYPDRHTFSIRKPAEGGVQVCIEIPLRFADYKDRASNAEPSTVVDCLRRAPDPGPYSKRPRRNAVGRGRRRVRVRGGSRLCHPFRPVRPRSARRAIARRHRF